MKVLLVGSGGREHALAWRLARTGPHVEIHAAPGNPGIAGIGHCHPVRSDDLEGLLDLARQLRAELVVIGPEAPLVAGLADVLRRAGIAVFGPSGAAARIEGSKSFAKDVLLSAGVATARSLVEPKAPCVIKADGLAAGKGVFVCTTPEEVAAGLRDVTAFAGEIVVEELLVGDEVSLFALCDGVRALPLTPAQDFKRAYDGDAGPNTGGMGAYSPLPWLSDRWGSEASFVDEVLDTIALPTVRALEAEGAPFIGLLYCGLIVTAHGIRVIEFNARFGDPETQVVLPRLDTPLSELLLAAATGGLGRMPYPTFSNDACVIVVLASEGYPDEPVTGRPIDGLDAAAAIPGVTIAHAATVLVDGAYIATGGRVLGVVARSADFTSARRTAYDAIEHIHLEGSFYRRDIAERVSQAEDRR